VPSSQHRDEVKQQQKQQRKERAAQRRRRETEEINADAASETGSEPPPSAEPPTVIPSHHSLACAQWLSHLQVIFTLKTEDPAEEKVELMECVGKSVAVCA